MKFSYQEYVVMINVIQLGQAFLSSISPDLRGVRKFGAIDAIWVR